VLENLVFRLRDRRPALGVLALLTALAFCCSSAFATFAGKNGRMAFTDDQDGRIHTILPDGAGERTLVPGVATTWSPNGRWIAGLKSRSTLNSDVFVVRADGTHAHALTHDRSPEDPPSYSPSSKRIVTVVEHQVVTMRASDGTHRRFLDKGMWPLYSPTRNLIAYYRVGDNPGAIWIMRADGSHKRPLTDPHGQDVDLPSDFSPDGRKIVFSRAHDTGVWTTYTVSIATGRVHRLGRCAGGYWAKFSPDGQYLLSGFPSPNGIVMKLTRADGSCPTSAAPGGPYGYFTAWQALPAG